MRTVGLFLILSLAFFALIFLFNLDSIKKRITFDYKITKVNARNVLKGILDMNISVISNNNSDIPFKIKNLKVDIFYNGSKISTVKSKELVINPGKSYNNFETQVILDKKSGELVKLLLNTNGDIENNPIPLTVKLKGKALGIPVSFSKEIEYAG